VNAAWATRVTLNATLAGNAIPQDREIFRIAIAGFSS
jgi:hypothetical protein